MKRHKPSLKEQLYWILGCALWLNYTMTNHEVNHWYYAISATSGYLAIVFTATAVWISINSRNAAQTETDEKKTLR